MIDTIREFGGEKMQVLVQWLPAKYSNYRKSDWNLYNHIDGEKTWEKKSIWNHIWVLCAVKWKCLKGRKDSIGKTMQPGSFCTCMKTLASLLKSKGMQYNFADDFNSRNEFHGQLKSVWEEAQKYDDTFGTCPNRMRTDVDMYQKFIRAFQDGILNEDNFQHLQMMAIIITQ